ncbi:hypothetical protein [Rhodobacter sp. NSM]|uniref:hypothetical protein n=1 Tax=Rhodobacter sp. NSM TaxID=3457501 RepID=UPI003FD4365B
MPRRRFLAIVDVSRCAAGSVVRRLMDACFVGTARVMPQPGDFYGGWVTPNLDGIPKGGPGTNHW